MKKSLRRIGIFAILIGLFLIANHSLASITGNVVSETVQIGGSILGLIFIVGGVALFLVKTALERKVHVYDVSKGKKQPEKERFYHMTDPSLYFSKIGDVSLSEFKRGVGEIEDDPELMQLVKEEYGSQLLDIEKRGTLLEKNVAEEFLKALHHGEIPREEKELISEAEINEIRGAFDPGWRHKPNVRQSQVLKKYGLAYILGKQHGKIYSIENPSLKTTTSITSSDPNIGKVTSKQIIGLLKEYRKTT